MSKIELFGTHGTCSSKLAGIKATGFHRAEGRIGNGVYFWYDTEDFDGFGLALGKAWANFKFPRSPKKSVIYVNISCLEDEYIDIEVPEVKIAIGQVAQKFNVPQSQTAKIHNLFITEFEKRKRLKIKVLQGRVAPPPEASFSAGESYNMKLLGAPVSICVIDPISTIKLITEVEY